MLYAVTHEKRTVSISVKMKPSHLAKIKAAAVKLWPGAVCTRSGIVLGLALKAADDALKRKPKK